MKPIIIILTIGLFTIILSCKKDSDIDQKKRLIRFEKFDSYSKWNFDLTDDVSTANIQDGKMKLNLVNDNYGINYITANYQDLVQNEDLIDFGFRIKIDSGRIFSYSEGFGKITKEVMIIFHYGNVQIIIPEWNLLNSHNYNIPEGTNYEVICKNGVIRFLVDGIDVDPNLISVGVGGSVYSNDMQIIINSNYENDTSINLGLVVDEYEFYEFKKIN